MALKFGTSGLRGLVQDLSEGAAIRYACAFATHLQASGLVRAGDKVLVGRDLRDSSPALAADCWAGLAFAGLTPVDCDAVPTPALAAYAMERGMGAIMVTGSHIPADRNGLKFYRPDGEIDKSDEQAIAAGVADLDVSAASMPSGVDDWQDAVLQAFRARFANFMAQDALSGLKVGIYAHSAVGRDVLSQIVASFGADVVSLGRSDRFIPVDTEAVDEATVDTLHEWTAEHGLDAILSTDGDSDRPLMSDHRGRPIRGDALGLIAARYLKAEIVVTPVTSNSGIERAFSGRVMRTRVGSPYVIEGMSAATDTEKSAIVIGFEANGGLLTGSEIRVGSARMAALPTRDAVLPMLAALASMAEQKRPLADLVSALDLPVALSGRVQDYAPERSAALLAALSDPSGAAKFVSDMGEVARTDTTDGTQIFFADRSMIHVRPSGNAPEMRCYAEAPALERAEALLGLGLEKIRAFESPVSV